MEGSLNVRMLGEFSITLGEISIDDSDSRARKVWLLLAYLIYHHRRTVSQEELISLLWESKRKDNPRGALNATIWRVRRALEPLETLVGQELILRQGEGYVWNQAVPLVLDAEVFESLCRQGSAAPDQRDRLACFRQALDLYQGAFLGKLSAELWVEPLTAYYQNLHLNTMLETLPLLRAEGFTQEVVGLCRSALLADPYQEELYRHLMLSYLDAGDYRKAANVYEEMRELLLVELGILPSEETQALYQSILRHISGYFLTPDMIRGQLREADPPPGALICDYVFFKLFYQAEARSAARRGDAVHIGVLSVLQKDGKEIPRNMLDRTMENLRDLIQNSLRRGDVAARCSASQYVILLLQANFENSIMVCQRIAQAYGRIHPYSTVKIHCSVLPLEPLTGNTPPVFREAQHA